MTYVYDDVTYVYNDVTYVYDDVTQEDAHLLDVDAATAIRDAVEFVPDDGTLRSTAMIGNDDVTKQGRVPAWAAPMVRTWSLSLSLSVCVCICHIIMHVSHHHRW